MLRSEVRGTGGVKYAREPGEIPLLDDSHLDWREPEALEQLCASAKKPGFLEDVELMSVMAHRRREEFPPHGPRC